MDTNKVKEYLEKEKTYYGCVEHPLRHTSQEVAVSAQIPPSEMAKSVVLNIDGRLAMAVLRADEEVDLERLKMLTGAGYISLAREEAFCDTFDDCDVGAIPPFGILYDIPEIVDVRLGENDIIAFTAGSHTELLQLPYKIFERLAQPLVVARIAH